mmetsp:Transcript_55016/g.143177  ORF Transcript_55016/g.143177 Transcript_55016/m.143177 type:complete len:286 (-) Transcript_55016:337-1194(-)
MLAVDFEEYLGPQKLAVPADRREEVAGDHVEQTPAVPDLRLGGGPHGRDRRVVSHVGTVAALVEPVAQQLRGVVPPDRRRGLRGHRRAEVEVLGVRVRLRARVRQPAPQIEALGLPHGFLRAHAQAGAGHLQHGHGVQGLWPGLPVLLLGDVGDLGGSSVLEHQVSKSGGNGEVEDLTTLPLQIKVPSSFGDLHVHGVETLRLEAGDLVVPLDAKPQSRCLAGPVRDQVGVQISVLSLKILRLEPRERAPQLQVYLLARVHRAGLILVGRTESIHRLLEIHRSKR